MSRPSLNLFIKALIKSLIKFLIKPLSVLLLTGLLLTACHPPEDWKNKGNPAVDQINESMEHAIANNKAIKQQNTLVSQDVSNALLPNLQLQSSDNEALARFDVAVDNMQVRTFFMGLVKDTPYNIVVDSDIKGSVTLHLKQVTIPEVLDALENAYGYQYHIEKFGIFITKNSLETRTFKIHYLDVERSGSSVTTISSGQPTQNNNSGLTTAAGTVAQAATAAATGQGPTVSQVETRTESHFWKVLSATVSSIVGVESETVTSITDSSTDTNTPGAATATDSDATETDSETETIATVSGTGPARFTHTNTSSVVVNPAAGLVVVTASPKVLHTVANYLDEIQMAMTQQVMIEAKILEVTLSKAYQAGIDWNILGASQSGTSNIVSNDNLNAFNSVFTLEITDGDLFNTTINLLSTQGNVQVLSSPRISTLNNQKALIKVGQDEYFITDVSNTITGTSTTTENTQDVEITPFFSGIALDVTPEISGNNQVLLHIHPIVSRVTDHTINYTINDTEQSLPSALTNIKESDNLVKAKSGQIVVIGGLMENRTQEYLGDTPFVDKIPFVGSLFRKTDQASTNSELVILLKPVIVTNSDWTTDLESISKRFKALKRGYHFGNHPDRFGNLGEFEQAE